MTNMIGPAPTMAFADMSPAEFAGWMHNPVTKAFFAYLADQGAEWEQAFVHLWRSGYFNPKLEVPAPAHPEFLRGQVQAFSELAEISLATLQEFYAAATEADD